MGKCGDGGVGLCLETGRQAGMLIQIAIGHSQECPPEVGGLSEQTSILENKVDGILEKKADDILEKKVDDILEKKADDILEKKVDDILEKKADSNLEKKADGI